MTAFKDQKRDRRGFLTNFLSDIKTSRRETREELQKNRTRASVLALKYAKNDLALTRIGLESPKFLKESTFTVQVTGFDQAEATQNIQLTVNTETRSVELPKTDDESK